MPLVGMRHVLDNTGGSAHGVLVRRLHAATMKLRFSNAYIANTTTPIAAPAIASMLAKWQTSNRSAPRAARRFAYGLAQFQPT